MAWLGARGTGGLVGFLRKRTMEASREAYCEGPCH